jgi:hypothetical protein
VFLSTDPSNINSYYLSGNYFDYNAIVYGIAKVSAQTVLSYHIPEDWESITTKAGFTYYKIGSCKVTTKEVSNVILTVYELSERTSFTVQIKVPTNAYSTYISTSSTATSGTDVSSPVTIDSSTSTYYGFVKIASSVMLQYNPNAN